MTREEAIKWFERAAPKNCSECPKESDFSCSYANSLRCEAHMLARAALREQEERSKGCDFCRADKEGYYAMAGAFSISNPHHAGKYYLNCGRVKPRRIMFCPMCGRKLGEDA